MTRAIEPARPRLISVEVCQMNPEKLGMPSVNDQTHLKDKDRLVQSIPYSVQRTIPFIPSEKSSIWLLQEVAVPIRESLLSHACSV